MLLLVAYLGGILTIVSPCILPVLPFVFARVGQSFARSTLPMLAGMAVMFAAVATLASLGGGWAVHANEAGRILAMLIMAFFGITLIFPSVADRAMRPLVAAGAKLSALSDANRARPQGSILASFALGAAVGMLWAPCAGPILGIILTGAALRGAGVTTTGLLFAYALGAATSLAVALLAGGRVLTAMKRSLGAAEWVRRTVGVAVLAGVCAVACGLDTGLLTRWSLGDTNKIEETLVSRLTGRPVPTQTQSTDSLGVEGTFPPFPPGAVWFNSPPLTPAGLRGKVVLIDFWTYSCINCLRALPYVHAWAAKYGKAGLVVIGVHSPEFGFEKDTANVRRAIANLGVTYPVVIDNDLAIWNAFHNEYWPAHYFIDAQGRIRHHHFGEGGYAESERVIQTLLREAGSTTVPAGTVTPDGIGVEATSNRDVVYSPETYIGYDRAERFVPDSMVDDASHRYRVPDSLRLNQWALGGTWTVAAENAMLTSGTGRIRFHFRSRDVHLVLGPPLDHRPIRFRVTIDGKAPGASHGTDTDASGNGAVTDERLYQLIRQPAAGDHTFEIEFLDPGVRAFSFTFG